MPIDEYLDWSQNWISGVFQATALTGTFWLNLGYVSLAHRARAIPLPYLLWPRIPFFLVQEIVWNYGAGVASRRMFSPRNEKWLWCVKNEDEYTFNLDAVRDPNVKYPNQKKNGKFRVNQTGKNPSDVWQIPKVTTGEGMTGSRASPERTAHPAQFPEAVVERIILACSNAGDLILDPFGGSGTTAAVAMSLGRPCVLFEIAQQYVDIAARRLQKIALRLNSEQVAMFQTKWESDPSHTANISAMTPGRVSQGFLTNAPFKAVSAYGCSELLCHRHGGDVLLAMTMGLQTMSSIWVSMQDAAQAFDSQRGTKPFLYKLRC
jgi:adenine-specific DNA-methyltransferase